MKKGEQPTFALVDSIFIAGETVLLMMTTLKVKCFNRHRYAYQGDKSGELYISHPGQEVSPQRLDLYFGVEIMPRCEICTEHVVTAVSQQVGQL